MYAKMLMTLVVLSGLVGGVPGAPQTGSITDVKDGEVVMELKPGAIARPGDKVDLFFVTASGVELPVGSLIVESVSGSTIRARVGQGETEPSRGLKVVVSAGTGGATPAEPRQKAQPKPLPVPKPAPAPKPTPEPAPRPESPPEPAFDTPTDLVGMLQSDDPEQLRQAARTIYRSHGKDLALCKAVEEVLLAGYAKDKADNMHIDAMSWACRVLGNSQHVEFRETLDTVAREAPSAKLKKYALKSARSLR